MLAISIVFSSRDSGLIISFHIEIVSTRPPRKNYNWSDLWNIKLYHERETNGKLQLWRAVVRRPLAGSRRQTVEVEAAGSPSPFARRKVIREACQGGGSALFVQRGRTGRSVFWQWSVFSLGVLCDIDNLNWKLTGQKKAIKRNIWKVGSIMNVSLRERF